MDDNEFEVSINGKRVIAYSDVDGSELKPGDMYIGKRNTGWELGKCLEVDPKGWVNSDPLFRQIYSYDCHECRKVKEIIE